MPLIPSPCREFMLIKKKPFSCKLFDAKCSFPISFFKAYQNKAVTDKNRTLHNHSVWSQQVILLILVHVRKLVLELQFLIQKPAGVEELIQWQTALFMPFFYFLHCRIILFDIPFFKNYAIFCQPFLSLQAGCAFRVAYKYHNFPPFSLSYIIISQHKKSLISCGFNSILYEIS